MKIETIEIIVFDLLLSNQKEKRVYHVSEKDSTVVFEKYLIFSLLEPVLTRSFASKFYKN